MTTDDVTPGSAAWTARLTASRFWRLFGGPASWVALRRDMESPPKPFTAAATSHGVDNEPRARMLYELETGNTVTIPKFRTLATNDRIGASVDGLVNHDGIVEIKCPVDISRHLLARQGIYDWKYHWQMVGGMWVWEREWADFISFYPESPSEEWLAVIRVPRQDADVKKLSDTANWFLDWSRTTSQTPVHDFVTPGATGLPKLF